MKEPDRLSEAVELAKTIPLEAIRSWSDSDYANAVQCFVCVGDYDSAYALLRRRNFDSATSPSSGPMHMLVQIYERFLQHGLIEGDRGGLSVFFRALEEELSQEDATATRRVLQRLGIDQR